MQTKAHIQPARRAATRGFTLVEALIAATLMALMFLAVAQTSSRAADAFDEGNDEHVLQTSAHRAMDRMAEAFELAGRDCFTAPVIDPALGSSTLTFRTPIGFAGGVVQWSGWSTITLELEPGETADGVDNDTDGLIDEGRVVRIDDPGLASERRVVLVSGVPALLQGELANGDDDNGNGLVDEPGLSFSASGDVLTLRLTCQRPDDAGRVLTKNIQTAVRLRN